MKSKRIRVIFILFLLFQSFWLAGCAAIQTIDDMKFNTRYRRFYSGEVRPRSEVAIFISTTGWGGGWALKFDTIDDGKELKKIYRNVSYPSLGNIGDGEFLPGHYKLGLRFDTRGLASVNSIIREIEAQPGHVYFIDPNLSDDGKSWNPIIQDIGAGNDEDFKKIRINGRIPSEKEIQSIRYIFNIAMRGPNWRKAIVQNKNGSWE